LTLDAADGVTGRPTSAGHGVLRAAAASKVRNIPPWTAWKKPLWRSRRLQDQPLIPQSPPL
jgi:hypothetical protein